MEGGVTGDDEPRLCGLWVGAPGVVAYPGNIGPPLVPSVVGGAHDATARHRYTDDNDADRRSSSVLPSAVAVGHRAHHRARDIPLVGIPDAFNVPVRSAPNRIRGQ